MILIYAASNERPDILNNAPSFVHKSLDYLKDEYSQYFKNSASQQKVKAVDNQKMEEEFFSEASTEEDFAIVDKINNFYQMGLMTQVLKLTKNSFLQVEKSLSNLKELRSNQTDLKLSLYYLVCKFLHLTFNIKDDLKALEIKLCILSRYPSLSQTTLKILNYATVCIYLRLLDTEIDDTTVVYHSRFIELAEILYELINDQGEAAPYKNARTMIMLDILQDKQKSMT